MARLIGPDHVVAGDARILVLDEGPTDADLTFLLIHGWGASSTTWAEIIPGLVERGRVISFDMRGHGGSTLGGDRVTLGRIVDDAVTIIAAAQSGPVVVVGHSLGGSVASLLAVDHPHLVEGLVVIDPAYGADDAEMLTVPDRLADYFARGGIAAAEGAEGAFGPGTPRSLVIRTAHAALASHSRALGELFESNYVGPKPVGDEAAAAALVASVAVPALAFYPSESRARIDREDGRRTVEVWPGTGHFLHQERPAEFVAAVLEWVDRDQPA